MNDKEFKQKLIIALASSLPFESMARDTRIKVDEILIGVADKVCNKLNEQDADD